MYIFWIFSKFPAIFELSFVKTLRDFSLPSFYTMMACFCSCFLNCSLSFERKVTFTTVKALKNIFTLLGPFLPLRK